MPQNHSFCSGRILLFPLTPGIGPLVASAIDIPYTWIPGSSIMTNITRALLVLFVFTAAASAQPLKPHPRNGHYFIFRGEPTILVTSGEHYGAVLNLDFDYRKYLQTLRACGLNYTRMFTGVYVEDYESFNIEKNTLAPLEGRVITPWARSNTPGYGKGGNKFNLDQWNPDYFMRLKDFISTADEYGIIVEVTLFTSIYNDGHWKLSPLHPESNVNNTDLVEFKNVQTPANGNLWSHQERMTRKLIRELNEFDNVFFEIQNEPYVDQAVTDEFVNPFDAASGVKALRKIKIASKASLEWQERIASVIIDEEKSMPKRHLIAQNFCNMYYPIQEELPHVSIINFHYAPPEAVLLNYGWKRVIGFDESGFAGNADSTYRKQAWKFILAGGGLFNNLDYSFASRFEDGSYRHAKSPGGGSADLRTQLKILKDFIHEFNFIDMHPDRSVVKAAAGVSTYVLAEPGKQYAIFVDGGSQCNLEVLLSPGTFDVEWIDTKTGKSEKRERVQSGDGTIRLSSPEYHSDIAVRILRK